MSEIAERAARECMVAAGIRATAEPGKVFMQATCDKFQEIVERAIAESLQRQELFGRAMTLLKGLNLALRLEWELAPSIVKEIADICAEYELGDGDPSSALYSTDTGHTFPPNPPKLKLTFGEPSSAPPDKNNLLACPFCNGERGRPKLEELSDGWRVSCYGCRVSTFKNWTKTDAIKTWNHRSGPVQEVSPASSGPVCPMCDKPFMDVGGAAQEVSPPSPDKFKAALEMIENYDSSCECDDHTQPECCANISVTDCFCAHCIAGKALL